MYSEPEDDPLDEEEIEFESDQEDVVTAGYEAEEGAGTSDDWAAPSHMIWSEPCFFYYVCELFV